MTCVTLCDTFIANRSNRFKHGCVSDHVIFIIFLSSICMFFLKHMEQLFVPIFYTNLKF